MFRGPSFIVITMQEETTPIFKRIWYDWTQQQPGIEPTNPLDQCWVPPIVAFYDQQGLLRTYLLPGGSIRSPHPGSPLYFGSYRVFAEEMMAVARELSKNETSMECIVVSRDSLQETTISALDCRDADDWAKQIKVIRQTLMLHNTLHTATVVLVPVRKLNVKVNMWKEQVMLSSHTVITTVPRQLLKQVNVRKYHQPISHWLVILGHGWTLFGKWKKRSQWPDWPVHFGALYKLCSG